MASLYLICAILFFVPHVCTFDLTILHTNDIHGRLEQFDLGTARCSEEAANDGECFGGVARIQTVVKQTREEVDNVLLLDAGDVFQGTSWFQYYEGEATAYFMNLLQYDAMTIGNHDFDLGTDKLAEFLRNLTFPIVSANIDVSGEPALQGTFTKSIVKELNGELIGIVGYTYIGTPAYSHIPVGNTLFEFEVEAVQKEVDILVESGINKIIALGHSGYATDLEVAEKVKGVDIVVGGHSDTFLFTGAPPSTEYPVSDYPAVVSQEHDKTRKVPVVNAFAYGKYLGRLNVEFDDDGEIVDFSGNAILLDKTIEQDSEFLAQLSILGAPVRSIGYQVIGSSNVYMNGTFTECCSYECNLGNLLTDAYVRYYVPEKAPENGWTDVSIAIEVCGNIRGTINQGEVIFEDVVGISPFRTTIDAMSMYGAALKGILELSVETYDKDWERKGLDQTSFMQFSGLRVTYDVSRDPSDRVVDVLVLCTDCVVPEYYQLEEGKIYKVALSSYVYKFIKDIVFDYQPGTLDTTVIREYIEQQSPLVTGLENRIRFVEPRQVLPPTMPGESKTRKDNVAPPERNEKLRKQL